MAKERGRQRKQQTAAKTPSTPRPCPGCGSTEHRNTRAKTCTAHKQSTNELLEAALGKNPEFDTRKITFDAVFREKYRDQVRTKIEELSSYLRL
ncbi:hypothetical protein EC973_003929, partial [Apophysomyces ossiformis]